MKKLLLGMLCLVMGTLSYAQSLDFLTFRNTSGEEVSLSVNGLKITFQGQQLHAVGKGGKVDLDLKNLSTMFFASAPTGIAEVENNTGEPRIVNGRLVVDAPEGTEVTVYTLDGRRVDAGSDLRGIYLVRMNGRTHKLMAK